MNDKANSFSNMKCFTSSRVGIDGWAPERVTAIAAAAFAKLNASRSISLWAQITANAAAAIAVTRIGAQSAIPYKREVVL